MRFLICAAIAALALTACRGQNQAPTPDKPAAQPPASKAECPPHVQGKPDAACP